MLAEFGFAYFAIFKILGLGVSVCRFDVVLVVWWSVVFAFDEFGLSWPGVAFGDFLDWLCFWLTAWCWACLVCFEFGISVVCCVVSLLDFGCLVCCTAGFEILIGLWICGLWWVCIWCCFGCSV